MRQTKKDLVLRYKDIIFAAFFGLYPDYVRLRTQKETIIPLKDENTDSY